MKSVGEHKWVEITGDPGPALHALLCHCFHCQMTASLSLG